MKRSNRRLTSLVLAAAGLCLAASAAFAGDAPALSDYEDFQQLPMRNADLAALCEQADLITAVQFDAKKLSADAKSWPATVVRANSAWNKRQSQFKGPEGKALGESITLAGDPKAFSTPLSAPELDPKKSFGFTPSRREFIVFCKATDQAGVYRPLDACPGGMQLYYARGRGVTDHRTLYVGQVNGHLVIEGGPGYRDSRMSGPTRMLDVLRGLRIGASLSAASAGGAAVDVQLRIGGARVGPGKLVLAAPILWAELEGPAGDSVLLSADDYHASSAADSPVVEAAKIPDRKASGRVELYTGPVPAGAQLTWAHSNHRKPLAGSLGEGEHTVRLLACLGEDVAVISNPVKVTGAKGAAGPEQVAALNKPAEPAAEAAGHVAAGQAPGQLDKSTLAGEIWFDSNRDGRWDIFVMNADGSGLRNVTNTPDVDEYEPRVSADGKQVVYVVGKLTRPDVWGQRWHNGQIWVANRDGSGARKVADAGARPAFGADSHTLAYTATVDKKATLVVLDLQTGQTRQPLDKLGDWFRQIGGIIYAGQSRKVAFGGKLWTQTGSSLYSADLDENYQFKSFKAINTAYHGCAPRWSADGTRLHFAHHDPKYNGAIILWTVQADGQDPRRFETPTRRSWPGYDPVCESPDGKFVAYSAGGMGDVCVMRLSDGASVTLTERKNKVYYGGLRWAAGVQEK